MLEKLFKLTDKNAKVVLNSGESFICVPLQYLEEEYESFLVRVSETSGMYSQGSLVELEESQIKSVVQV